MNKVIYFMICLFFVLFNKCFLDCISTKDLNEVNYLIYEKDKAHRNVTIEHWTISGKIKSESSNIYYWTVSFYKSGFSILPSIFNYAMISFVDLSRKSFSSFTYGNPSMIVSAEKAISFNLNKDLGNKDLKDSLDRVKNKIFNNFALLPEPYGIASSEKPLLLYGPLKFERHDKNKLCYFLKIEFLSYAMEVELNSNDYPLIYDGKNVLKVGDKEKVEGYVIGNMKISGKIKKDEVWEKVDGEGLYNHMWGNWNKTSAWSETNRMLIVLENGMKLNYHTFKDRIGSKTIADQIFFMKGKNVEKIEGQFLKILEKWDSLASKRKYKINWEVMIPQKKINLQVTPVLKEQEVSVIENMGAFWFGNCEVNGSIDGKKLKGFALVKSLNYEKISD